MWSILFWSTWYCCCSFTSRLLYQTLVKEGKLMVWFSCFFLARTHVKIKSVSKGCQGANAPPPGFWKWWRQMLFPFEIPYVLVRDFLFWILLARKIGHFFSRYVIVSERHSLSNAFSKSLNRILVIIKWTLESAAGRAWLVFGSGWSSLQTCLVL